MEIPKVSSLRRSGKHDQEKAQKHLKMGNLMIEKAQAESPGNAKLFSQAIAMYGRAIAADSQLIEAYLALAYLAWKLEDAKAALSFCKTALEISPGDPFALSLSRQIKQEINLTDPPKKKQAQMVQKSEATLKPISC